MLLETIPKKVRLLLIGLALAWFTLHYVFKLSGEAKHEDTVQNFERAITERQQRVARSLQSLNLADANLKTCIELAAKELASIHPGSTGGIDDVAELKNLYCPNKGIRSLEGIGGLRDLQFIDISRNHIKDASPLRVNQNLRFAYLKGNPIVDIGFLKSLPQLERVILPSLPNIKCSEIALTIGSVKSNLKTIACAKQNQVSRLPPSQEKKTKAKDFNELSSEQESEMMDYELNLRRGYD